MSLFRVGFDLDGIICPDVTVPSFLRRFNLAWRVARCGLKPKHTPYSDALIVTGRPLCDEFYTLKWLRAHRINNKVVFNPYGPGFENSVRTKIEAILRWNLHRYYESDREQTEAIRLGLGRDAKAVVTWVAELG